MFVKVLEMLENDTVNIQLSYQDLCRQHMASKGAFGRLEAAALGAVGGASGGGGVGARAGAASLGGGADSRVSSVSSQFSDGAQPSPSSHSSTPSWGEEPAQANMDISTGHMILVKSKTTFTSKKPQLGVLVIQFLFTFYSTSLQFLTRI